VRDTVVIVPRALPSARASGSQTAQIVGLRDVVATTERDHQVKIQSKGQRGAVPHAGGQFIPRIGTEVLIDFIDGDMGRPIIVGQLYTGSDLPLYSAGVDSGIEHAGVLSGYHTNKFDGGGFNQPFNGHTPGQLRARLATGSAATKLKLGYHSRCTNNDRSDCKSWQSRARYQRKQKNNCPSMSQPISNNAVMLPSNFERQQIFYWLKKVSSVTAWRRIFSFYEAWAEATENSVRVADESGRGQQTSLPHSEYALILKCLAHCEEGVNRLSKGDKRVFKFDSNGEFVMAQRMLSHWTKMLERIELGENGINEHTPLWPEFCNSLTTLANAWGECGPHILEPRYIEEPAQNLYGDWLKSQLMTSVFPTRIAPVPDPVDNVFAKTHEITPHSGIREPIEVETSAKIGILSFFVKVMKPQPPFKVMGAMNYLHAGSKAPQITIETDDDSIDLDTTWRLLWKDDRYQDGSVSEEEASYIFLK
jgi:hypothetical protein